MPLIVTQPRRVQNRHVDGPETQRSRSYNECIFTEISQSKLQPAHSLLPILRTIIEEELLSLSNGIELIAVNGKRGWYRHLDASSAVGDAALACASAPLWFC